MSQLLATNEKLMDFMGNSASFDTIDVDFRKAFDTVAHRRLFVKLKAYGISGTRRERIL
jgi:hypothetical protein